MAAMGRPKIPNPKATQIAVRLDNETVEKLDAIKEETKENRVQIIRRGIERLYSDIKK